MQQDLEELLQKRMDRKDFIKHLAVGFAALTGVSAILKTLSGLSSQRQANTYGSSAYGGGKARRS